MMTDEEKRKKRALSDLRMQSLKHHVLVCNGGCCVKNGSGGLIEAFRSAVSEANAADFIRITETKCTGRCIDSCSVVVYPEGVWYRNIRTEHVALIVQEHLLRGNVVPELVSYVCRNGKFVKLSSDPLEGLSQL
ncbi:(2Fe-2S) ferredoxin [Alicyclobacillus cycloheptanicus]|uniref:(2Fe-2S) ferredoxin n=1 Tax=Alicyclobacillus cycloheptanicus TaxID=1457 RepID=A0ABT9XH99_9BACL|nr:(2Fe-2S) ferredoxin [Alicyclobacillus cycloheptanicus]